MVEEILEASLGAIAARHEAQARGQTAVFDSRQAHIDAVRLQGQR